VDTSRSGEGLREVNIEGDYGDCILYPYIKVKE
jgi:hypothetical protein